MKVPTAARALWLRSYGEQAEVWLDRLPTLSLALMERWGCRASGPAQAGSGGVVQPVVRNDGGRAVLKISFPHPAEDMESRILALWAGRGAVLMLERDDANRARLLEELSRTSLADLEDGDESMFEAGRLARQLAVPAPEGLPRLDDACARWQAEVPEMNTALGTHLPAKVIDSTIATCQELGRVS